MLHLSAEAFAVEFTADLYLIISDKIRAVTSLFPHGTFSFRALQIQPQSKNIIISIGKDEKTVLREDLARDVLR
jgi:hypothetical protein